MESRRLQSDFYGNFMTIALALWKVININKASLDNGHFRGINKHDTDNGSFEFFMNCSCRQTRMIACNNHKNVQIKRLVYSFYAWFGKVAGLIEFYGRFLKGNHNKVVVKNKLARK